MSASSSCVHPPPCLPRFLAKLGRHNYVTPTSYLELISSFKRLLSMKREEIMKMKKRYLVGLEKLASAASQVGGVWVPVARCSPPFTHLIP